YGHHRGIMIGWKRIWHGDKAIQFWGMEDHTVIKHIKYLEETAGPVMAKTKVLIHWNDSLGNTIMEEERQAVIYHQNPSAILLLDFTSTIKPVIGPVRLDGDAEHGGVQYRAHDDVAQDAPGSVKPTYFFHEEGIDPREDYNLPWVGMQYGLRNKSYSVVQMNHSGNPEPTIWSAYRTYGRFGIFFPKELDKNESLTIHYRFWISEDTMPDRDILNSMYDAYENPPQIQVINK
ncbi:DUF6807 family protein, partial [Bacteroidota bacterium]